MNDYLLKYQNKYSSKILVFYHQTNPNKSTLFSPILTKTSKYKKNSKES